MSAHIYPPEEFDSSLILASKVAIIGYGNQGHAQALNLRDSGVNVTVASTPGRRSFERATADGFKPVPIWMAAQQADILVLSLPDEKMATIYRNEIQSALRSGQTLLFVHGFNLRFELIQPPEFVNAVIVVPKGSGWGVRTAYEEGKGVAALLAVHQDADGRAEKLALSYAWGLGCARSMVLRTTVAEETETDLFGEQTVLCGGIPPLIEAAFETLVKAGYQPEVAYFETLYETKLIVDLIIARGLSGMREAISSTAEWGGDIAADSMVTGATRDAMRQLLARIKDGSFAKEWMAEAEHGEKRLQRFRQVQREHASEAVGAEIRKHLNH